MRGFGAADSVGRTFPHFAWAPYDESVDLYLHSRVMCMGSGSMVPLEYSGWRDEQLSWKDGCYVHTGLNPATTFSLKGPDAERLLSDVSVNSFAGFRPGAMKHVVMCDPGGLIMAHGMVLKLGEEEFITYFLAPYLAYRLQTRDYRAVGEYVGDWFLLQLGGPRSLEVLEVATGECLHDLAFMRHRTSSIAGRDVRIGRMGMAGTLAYEVHGRTADAVDIYHAILKAGSPYGIRKLGFIGYQMNHTENGFPQSHVHFPLAWAEDGELMAYLGYAPGASRPGARLRGSMGADLRLRYRNPVELGWAKLIRFDHDFVGRAALEEEVRSPRRRMVTLVWKPEDLVDLYASQFRSGEQYLPMDPIHISQQGGCAVLWADQVLKDGSVVGVSSGRAHSYYYRQMLSLCSIDTAFSEPGTGVEVLWGDPGTRQKRIRATVSRFPYLNENRNEAVDVAAIACAAPRSRE